MTPEQPRTLDQIQKFLEKSEPRFCRHLHEQRTEVNHQEMRRRRSVGLPMVQPKGVFCEDRFSNPLCAHNHGSMRAPRVYEPEILELEELEILTSAEVIELLALNQQAVDEINRTDRMAGFDIATETQGDLDAYLAASDLIEERQRRTWKEYVDPLRKKLMKLITGKAA